jgi:hypothetical protein
LVGEPYLGPTAQPWVRWLSLVVAVAAAIGIVVSLATRL